MPRGRGSAEPRVGGPQDVGTGRGGRDESGEDEGEEKKRKKLEPDGEAKMRTTPARGGAGEKRSERGKRSDGGGKRDPHKDRVLSTGRKATATSQRRVGNKEVRMC